MQFPARTGHPIGLLGNIPSEVWLTELSRTPIYSEFTGRSNVLTVLL
jgi:hypothetical protein